MMSARAAQNGQGLPLAPDGLTVETMTFDFQIAVDHAFRVISWLDNLPEDEMPPEWMWPYDNLINEWFERVKANRKDGRDSSDPPLEQNLLAKGRGKDS